MDDRIELGTFWAKKNGKVFNFTMLRVILAVAFCCSLPSNSEALALQDEDKLVFIGNTFVERCQQYGYIESSMTLASGKKNLKFRNLGWSGDTVWGEARSYFGPPSEGFARLKSDLIEFKPTVVILCYGGETAFTGTDGVSEFISGYGKMIDMIQESVKPREVILMSPPPAENLGQSFPDMNEHNNRLALYSQAILQFAEKRKIGFADIFNEIDRTKSGLTVNGLHFSEEGYKAITPAIVNAMGMKVDMGLLESETGKRLREKISSFSINGDQPMKPIYAFSGSMSRGKM
jgi:lysophospholipase L1-like esterase